MKAAIIVGLVVVILVGAVLLIRDRGAEVVVPTELLAVPAIPVQISDPEPVGRCAVVVDASVSKLESGDASPGDVVCLSAGVRGPLRIDGISGTADEPVVVVNLEGVTVIEGDFDDYAGINIQNSTHLVITGAGMSPNCGAALDGLAQGCGIVVRGSGRGVAVIDRSEYITIDHLEISGTSHSGIYSQSAAKNGILREEFTQHGTGVFDNYVHDVGKEGLYLGSSSYADGLDPLLEGVHVARNLIVDSGWDGIQVGSAVDDCVIEDNRVLMAGTENVDDQRSGIINNRGSVCDILANVVFGSAAQGIYLQGNGGNLVANNLIIQPGHLSPHEGDGITVTRGSNEGNGIRVVYNTVVAAPEIGIDFRNDAGAQNQVVNNLVAATPSTIEVGDGDVTFANNLSILDIDSGAFEDPSSSDFRLTARSVAIDAGMSLPEGPAEDLSGRPRPDGAGFDAGAFEYQAGIEG